MRQGDKVETPLGTGNVCYVRLGADGRPAAVSVLLDTRRPDAERGTYSGTMFPAADVRPCGAL